MIAGCGAYMMRKSRSQKENQKMRISFHHVQNGVEMN